MPPFTEAEVRGRIDAARRSMAAAKLDAIIVTSGPAFYYLTGAPIFPFGRPPAVLIPLGGDPIIVCSIIEQGHLEAQSPIQDRRYYWDFNDRPVYTDPVPPLTSMVRLLKQCVLDRGLAGGRIGYEDWTLPVRTRDVLRDALSQAALLPASDLLDRLRLVKSTAEIDLIRAADAIADRGEETLLGLLKEGVRARTLHAAVYGSMLNEALEHHADAPFHVRVGTGVGSVAKIAGHSEWISWGPEDAVKAGQVLATTQTATLWGYGGNVERAVVVGPPSPRVKRDYEIMIEANERAIEAIRPGAMVSGIDAICKAVFSRNGYATRTGSGLGRGFVSFEGDYRELLMDLRSYSDLQLEVGMVFSLEPDLQTADGTYRHCNTIIVTQDGCEVDSRIDRGFMLV